MKLFQMTLCCLETIIIRSQPNKISYGILFHPLEKSNPENFLPWVLCWPDGSQQIKLLFSLLLISIQLCFFRNKKHIVTVSKNNKNLKVKLSW